MPWSEASHALTALLAALDAAEPPLALMRPAKAFYNESLGWLRWGQPTQQQRSSLSQGIARLGARLQPLGGPLQAALSDPALPVVVNRREGIHAGARAWVGPALAFLFSAALAARGGCFVAAALGGPQHESLQLCRVLPALLGAGRLQAANAATDLRRSAATAPVSSDAERWETMASVIGEVGLAVDLLLRLGQEVGAVEELVSQLAPPPAALAYLAALADLPTDIPAGMLSATGGWTWGLPDGLTDTLSYLLDLPPYSAAIAADPSLPASLVRCLLHALQAAAAAAAVPGQPPGQREGGVGGSGGSALEQEWGLVRQLANLLAGPSLAPALGAHLSQGGLGTAGEVLQAGGRLLAATPLDDAAADGPAFVFALRTHSLLASLLSEASRTALQGLAGPRAAPGQPAEEAQCCVLRAVLPVVPRLEAALQAVAGSRMHSVEPAAGGPAAEALAAFCFEWQSLLVFASMAAGSGRAAVTAGVPQLCGAATSALRALAQLPPTLQLIAQLAVPERRAQMLGEPKQLADSALLFVGGVAVAVKDVARQPSLQQRAQQDSSLGELLAGTLQLHAACCRAVHWAAAQPSGLAGLLPDGRDNVARALLLGTLSSLLAAASMLLHAADAPPERSIRRLRGSCAAHWEALQALLAGDGTQLGLVQVAPVAASCAAALALVAADGLAALARCSEVYALLQRMLAAVKEEDHGVLATCHRAILQAAARSPRLAAHLAASGLLGQILQGAAGGGAPPAAAPAGTPGLPSQQEALAAAASALSPLAEEASKAALPASLTASLQTLATRVASAAESGEGVAALPAALASLLAEASAAAAALLQHWEQQSDPAAEQLELARAAATRSCANLRCANLAAEGGAFGGQLAGSKKCSACRAVWYCSQACSVANWKLGGHKRDCSRLKAAAAPAAERVAAAAAAAQG